MRCSTLALCTLIAALAAMARAQAPGSFSIKCNPAMVNYQFDPTQAISTQACTTDAVISGVPFKALTFSQAVQYGATENSTYGVIVGTLASGDQVFFEFHTLAQHAVNAPNGVGSTTYKIVGGTGAAAGISGSGNCTGAGAKGEGSELACIGAYVTR